MEKVIKQAAGIDCGFEELVVSFSQLFDDGNVICKSTKSFTNNEAGFEKLFKWAEKLSDTSISIIYVMEPTGVYHEKLAYHLYQRDCTVSIVLPNKVNAYAKTCVCKQQDDQQASKVLAEFGCVKKLNIWQPPHPVYAQLKQLAREKTQLQQEHAIVLNQLHAEEAKAIPGKPTIRRMKARLRLLEKQIVEIENEIKDIVDADEQLQNRIENVCTIPGVGLSTAVAVVGETNGFNLIKNNRQLVSYAGLDVIAKQSGTSVRGRAHISKKGNGNIRRALYFPALVAVKYNKPLTNLYSRIMDKQDIKMKGYVAVQRKLLILIYTLWKRNEPFKRDHIKFLEQPVEAALTELD